MSHFSTTIIDNFLPNADEMRKFGLSLEYTNETSHYLGARSKSISEINIELYHGITTRYLLNHHTAEEMELMRYQAGAYFQKITGNMDLGWIHSDWPCYHTTIIYLTPDAPLGSGTCLYRPTEVIRGPSHTDKRKQFFDGELSLEEIEKYRLDANRPFEKVATINNVYNRCLGFDGGTWHSADNLNTTDYGGERLTLIIFWHNFIGPATGIHRMKNMPGSLGGYKDYIK